MQIGLFDIWKRILQSLGLIPPDVSRYYLKEYDPVQIRYIIHFLLFNSSAIFLYTKKKKIVII